MPGRCPGVDVKAPPGVFSHGLCGNEHQAEFAVQTLAIAAASGVEHEARTTTVHGVHDLDALRWIGSRLAQGGTKRWYLQKVRGEGIRDPSRSCVPPTREIIESAVKQASGLGLEVALRGYAS